MSKGTEMTTEQQTAVTLLPCPFCGGDVILDDVSTFLGNTYWKPACQDDACILNDRRATQEQAIAAWNTRLASQASGDGAARVSVDAGDEPVAYAPKGDIARYLKGRNTACWVYGSPTAEDNVPLYTRSAPTESTPSHEVDEDGKPTENSDPWFQLGWHKERLEWVETELATWKERAMLLRVSAPAEPVELREAAEGIDDDYMTSEKHHPGYVLIPTAKFEKIVAATKRARRIVPPYYVNWHHDAEIALPTHPQPSQKGEGDEDGRSAIDREIDDMKAWNAEEFGL